MIEAVGGAEVFILDGACSCDGDALTRHSWLSTPIGTRVNVVARSAGVSLWVKTGHLNQLTP